MEAYAQELNAQRASEYAHRSRVQGERNQIARKLDGLYDAIAEGLRTPGLKERLEQMEAKLVNLDAALKAAAPSPERVHPNLADIYRRKVTELSAALEDPEIRPGALEAIRNLIESVAIFEPADGVTLELEGAITAMIDLAQPAAMGKVDHSSVKVVAGARYQRYLPQLSCRIPLIC